MEEKYITKCTFICPRNDVIYELKIKDNLAVFTKSTFKKKIFAKNKEQKKVLIQYIQNLDSFFSSYHFDTWNIRKVVDPNKKDVETISLELDDGSTYSISNNMDIVDIEKNMFDEINKYMYTYWYKEVKPIAISFHSYDGGGAQYYINKSEPNSAVTWYSQKNYESKKKKDTGGAGYNIFFMFYPIRKGKATYIIKAVSPLYRVNDTKVTITVDDDLNLIKETETIEN